MIAEESLAVLKDPVESPGMQQKLVQKRAFVVHNQEIKAVPTKVYHGQPQTTTPSPCATHVCLMHISKRHPVAGVTPATPATGC